jgi:hypothetical protein
MVVPRNINCQITMGKRGRVDEVYYVNCNIYNTIEGKPMYKIGILVMGLLTFY